MFYIALILWVVFAAGRLYFVPVGGLRKQDIFKDLAHIYVGCLFGAGFYNLTYLWLALGITAVEVIAAVVRK